MTYDKPVTLQKQNEDTEKWEDVLHLHARVNKSGGKQSFAASADQFHAVLSFDFRWCAELEQVRYQPELYRLQYRGHTFQIEDYDDYMERHQTVRMAGKLYE